MAKTTNGVVKNRKPKKLAIVSKVVAAILSIGLMIGVGASLTACKNNKENTKNPTEVVNVTNVSDLSQNYSDETKEFLQNEVQENIIKYSTGNYDANNLIDVTYDLGDGEKTSLDSVTAIFTYKDGDNRLYNINEMTFEESLDLNKIAQYDENKTELSEKVNNATTTTEYSITYNAIEGVRNDALAEAIYDKVVGETEDPVHLILVDRGVLAYPIEGGTTRYYCTEYDLIAQTENSITSYNAIIKNQESSEELFESLNDSKNYKLNEVMDIYSGKTIVVGEPYQKEDIYVPPVIEADNVGELIANYPTKVQNFLKGQTNAAIQKVIGVFDENNIKAVRWDIGSDNNTKLSNAIIEFIVKDPTVEGKETYYRVNVNYNEPIELKAIAQDPANAATAIVDATVETDNGIKFEYSAKEQYFRAALVDALATKLNVPENAQVMIDFGEDYYGSTTFKVGYTCETGYVEYDLQVPTGENEAEMIKNVNEANLDYAIVGEYTDINSNAFVEKEYTEDTFVVNDIYTALQYYSDQIAVNLEPIYDFVKKNGIPSTYQIKSYTWDLGQVEDGNVYSLKFSAYMKDNRTGGGDIYKVFEITLPTPLTVNDLLNKSAIENISLNREDIYNLYTCSYDESSQSSSNDEFVKAVADYKDPEFDYTNAKLIYTNHPDATDQDYGECKKFTVVLISENGVREFYITTPMPNKDNTLLDYITTGRFKTESMKSVDYSNNQIEVGQNENYLNAYSEIEL